MLLLLLCYNTHTHTVVVFNLRSRLSGRSTLESSMMDGLGKAVVGVWRAHTTLDESDGAESSPEAPDRFRKLRSSSSLNSLRMSLRKRLPLRSVQANSFPENPTSETQKEQPKPNAVRKLTRSARNSITEVYQVIYLYGFQSVFTPLPFK